MTSRVPLLKHNLERIEPLRCLESHRTEVDAHGHVESFFEAEDALVLPLCPKINAWLGESDEAASKSRALVTGLLAREDAAALRVTVPNLSVNEAAFEDRSKLAQVHLQLPETLFKLHDDWVIALRMVKVCHQLCIIFELSQASHLCGEGRSAAKTLGVAADPLEDGDHSPVEGLEHANVEAAHH